MNFPAGARRLTYAFAIVTALRISLAACPASATTFQKDDQVILVRDEPLRLYQETKAVGKKGQVFAVLAYTPADHRVYLLANDTAGKPAGFNVSEDAVLLLPGRGDAIFQTGLLSLRVGRWADAAREFASAALAEPDDMLYADVKSRIDTLMRNFAALQQAQVVVDQAAVAAKQKRRNADISDHINPLTPEDHSGQVRAANDREAAKQLETNAQDGLKTATHNLEATLAEFSGYVRQRIDTKDYDVALAFASAVERLAVGGGHTPVLSGDEASQLDAAQALADATVVKAKHELAVSRLYSAERIINEGLAAVPTHRPLKALQVQVGLQLSGIEEGAAKVEAVQKRGDYDGALKLVNALLADCADSAELQRRKSLLAETIAQGDPGVAQAASDDTGRTNTTKP